MTPLEHGNIIFSEDRTSYGVVATYACHENYTLIGNENRTCGENGWTGTVPQCLVDWCPEPPSVAGGKVELTGKRAGSTAIYKCDLGHILIGDPVSIELCRVYLFLFSVPAVYFLRNCELLYTRYRK